MPKAVAMAVNTVMAIFSILLQMLFVSFSIVDVAFIQRRDAKTQRSFSRELSTQSLSPCLMNSLNENSASRRLCV